MCVRRYSRVTKITVRVAPRRHSQSFYYPVNTLHRSYSHIFEIWIFFSCFISAECRLLFTPYSVKTFLVSAFVQLRLLRAVETDSKRDGH